MAMLVNVKSLQKKLEEYPENLDVEIVTGDGNIFLFDSIVRVENVVYLVTTGIPCSKE